MRAGSLELLDDREEMADRAGQAIKPDHDQGFAGADLVQQARQHRPAAVCAGGVLLEHGGAARSAQLIELRIGALFLSRDPRIANQTAGAGGFRRFSRTPRRGRAGLGPATRYLAPSDEAAAGQMARQWAR